MRNPELPATDETEPVDEANKLIMPPDDYVKTEHVTPYVYGVTIGDSEISYVGAAHTSDPKSPTLSAIKDEYARLNPDIVVVEGFHDLEENAEHYRKELAGVDPDEAIKGAGEGKYALALAINGGAEFASPEAQTHEEVAYLKSKNFSESEILLYYIGRQIPQRHRRSSDGKIEDLEKFFEHAKPKMRALGFEYDGTLNQLAQEVWSSELSDDPSFYSNRIDPMPWAELKETWSRTNEVSQALNRLRDERLVTKLAQLAKAKKRILVVYGASHAVIEQPALNYLSQHARQD